LINWYHAADLGKGKLLAWDVTVPDTYADSHLADTVTTAGAAADKANAYKEAKYR